MWDEKYSETHYIYGKQPNDFLAQNSHIIPMGKVLCLAEGEGRNALFLAQQGYKVTAIDSSAVGLDKARKLADDNLVSIEFIHGDLADFDLGVEQWDGIVSIFCHLPAELRKAVHKKVIGGLKPNGVLLLEAYNPEQLVYATGGPPTADLMMTRDSLTDELFGLTFQHLQELEREVIEGTHHFGMGAVVQTIAIKT